MAKAPEYTIGQFYAAARMAPELKGARSFTENALIVTPSYRVSREMLQRYYFDPESGAQIKALQLYTVAREPAESFVSALPDEELDAIATVVRARVEIPVETYYGVAAASGMP